MGARKVSAKLKRQVLDYIASYTARYGAAPEGAAVQGAFLDAPAWELSACLRSLAKSGWIAGPARQEEEAAAVIPVQGFRAKDLPRASKRISAGSLLLNLAGIGCPAPKELYAVRVPDPSMSDAGLLTGDIAILCATAVRDGDIVAASSNGALTLRRYRIVADVPYLLAENAQPVPALLAVRAAIQGVLWASLRVASNPRRFNPSKTRKVDYTRLRRTAQPPAKRAAPARSGGAPCAARSEDLYLHPARTTPTHAPDAVWLVNEQAPKPTGRAKPSARKKAAQPESRKPRKAAR